MSYPTCRRGMSWQLPRRQGGVTSVGVGMNIFQFEKGVSCVRALLASPCVPCISRLSQWRPLHIASALLSLTQFAPQHVVTPPTREKIGYNVLQLLSYYFPGSEVSRRIFRGNILWLLFLLLVYISVFSKSTHRIWLLCLCASRASISFFFFFHKRYIIQDIKGANLFLQIQFCPVVSEDSLDLSLFLQGVKFAPDKQ